MSRFVVLIPFFPLLGFLFNLTVGVRVLTKRHAHGEQTHHEPSPIVGLVACGSVLLSFLVSVRARGHAGGDAVDLAARRRNRGRKR